MIKVGITGGIGVGKTYICNILKKMGYSIFSSDQVSKKIVFENTFVCDQIRNFFGEDIHPTIETGITYSLGWEEDYDGGLGVVIGGTIDYWFEDSPLGLRIFGNGYMIPSPEDTFTGFGNIGASILLSLKRSE